MAALVQGYPQQSSTATMLQTRPASASGMLQASHTGMPYGHGASQKRHSMNALPGGVDGAGYRGSSAPIQPYAFTATPSLHQAAPWQQYGSFRTNSAPVVPSLQTFEYSQPIASRPRYSASASLTNLPSTIATNSPTSVSSRDDLSIPGPNSRRFNTRSSQSSQASASSTQSSQSSFGQAASARASPERYRRSALRGSDPTNSGSGQGGGRAPATTSGAGRVAVGQNYGVRNMARFNRAMGAQSGSAVDDMQFARVYPQDDSFRFRRRSMPALDSAGARPVLAPLTPKQPEESTRLEQTGRPKSTGSDQTAAKAAIYSSLNSNPVVHHARAGSSDSRSSVRTTGSNSRPSSSANRNAAPTGNPASQPTQGTANGADYPRLVNIPPRSSSSSDAAGPTKRTGNPSPLSKPVSMDKEGGNGQAADVAGPVSPATPVKSTPSQAVESPAVKQLAALNQGGGRPKSKTSRLRRAFSFGSAADFRKAVHENDAADKENAPAKLHKDQDPEEAYNAEQARIAERQEAAGIGSNIYGGKLFSGSTDNLSISSTASSASIMIRKMGRGMKKGTRSLVGLFRPKSIIGAPAAEAGLPEAPQASVTMVTVEAERERVNVNPDPHANPGGATGFPHLERNSIDAVNTPNLSSERVGSSGTDKSSARRSLVGGEVERAAVLAAVRKGILKKDRSGTSTPSPQPTDTKVQGFDMGGVAAMTDSPHSSAPSTPNDEVLGHKRGGTVTIGSEDYFVSALRLRQDTKSAPGTPQGTMKRNATFNPRLMYHDTWPSQEYDRRGEIATCNRLTPMLAQQIKEELNTFKMEMEVHENSKIYTHFF
ncbi:hypothetical protein QBC39DRAFT_27488 [Podospora conica]|nr:hypothetical protein QBC39DRAFT_27488 [Schizothecium conicum]